MEQITSFVHTNIDIILLITLITAGLSALIVIINSLRLSSLIKKYKKMMQGANGQDLEKLLNTYSRRVEENLVKTEEVKSAYMGISKMVEKSIQHIGIIRYNAFDDTGSDLSFAVALLDYNGDGIVISSLFGRNETRTYAKPVKKGVSEYLLSLEEEQAIKKALQ